MRKVLEDKHLRGVKVMDGLSTNIPLPDASVDAVVIAQVGQFLFLTANDCFSAVFTISSICLQSVNDFQIISSLHSCAKRFSW